MKKLFSGGLIVSVLLAGAILATPTTASAHKLYTNPRALRHHQYWYSCQQNVDGQWGYSRLHFTKHGLHTAYKKNRNGKWHHYNYAPKSYVLQKHHGWYRFGQYGSDELYMYEAKMSWLNLDGHRHWTLSTFDFSDNSGHVRNHAPYTMWIYTTYLNDEGWYYDLNHEPHF